MHIPDKDTDRHIFIEQSDSDTAPEIFSNKRARKMVNCRTTQNGNKGIVTNILGSTLIANSLPAGNNLGIGHQQNKNKNKLYWFNYNDQGYHGIYCLDLVTGAITPVLLNLVDTNSVDILKFSPYFWINHIDIIQDNLIYWVDGYNKARKFNITKATDKSLTGYGAIITEDFITAYKQCGVYAPTVEYFTDLTRSSNYLYGLQFKFAYRFRYDDNEISNWGDWSAVALPPNESYLGQNAITFENNGIYVTLETGNRLVDKIEIAVKITNLDWQSIIVLNKDELNIPDYSTYVFQFFNDGAYDGLNQYKVFRPFSYLPRNPHAQAFVNVSMTYTRFLEGRPAVPVSAAIALTFNDFYLPDGTTSELNNPSVTISLTSTTSDGGLFNNWFTTLTHFVIGEDVKKGNVFTINSYGGNYLRGPGSTIVLKTFSYTAGLGDSASTVANAIKQWLRGIDGVGTNIISGETVDGSGNVIWDFTIEAHEGRNAITFGGSVTPVNFTTLLDNGLSLNSIKMGSTIKYGVVYEDEDGPTGLTNTSNALLIRTPFQTETLPGETDPIGLKQPVHTISIMNTPPLWAKYWRLVRTSGPTTFLQMIIQQVNTVEIANQDTYLDLLVGSLPTYNKIHKDSILKYDFERGDRIRLISDNSGATPVPYTPYFETEILGYSIDTEEFVNANVECVTGSNEVKPDKGIDAGNIGKYIIINDVERLITGVDTGAGKYILEFDFNPNPDYSSTATTTTVFPNFRLKDTRGTIRIKLPPPAYTVVNLSLVEISRPQQNLDNANYQDFFDFQQKFPVLNWGTANAAHAGNIQNQDPGDPVNTPAIVQVTNGDSYVRNRAMPSNNQDPNPQVIIARIADPNFSDFYESNLTNLGKRYPQDQGFGEVEFPDRTRFSNDYIQGTKINGLNDFDGLDFKDYNDQYGKTTLTKFLRGVLYYFKQLKTCWTNVNKNILHDNAGGGQLSSTNKLLNDLEYAVWEGGIGDNGEGYIQDGNVQYIPSVDSGVFIRHAQDGSIPISTIFFYDKRAREVLSQVGKYKLRLPGGFDRKNKEALWSMPDYIAYIFDNSINVGDWKLLLDAYPEDTVWSITQQPANATATIVGDTVEITGTTTLGSDFFKFKGALSAGGFTPIMNFCFTVILPEQRATAWRVKDSTLYCSQGTFGNTGQQGWKVLEEYYLDDNTLTGRVMPNASYISPLAIVPVAATITYNTDTNPAPSGGADGDIWYNDPIAELYKKVAGVWSLLTDKAFNPDFAAVITNTTDCPITPPTPGADNFTASAQYGYTIDSIYDGLGTTGVPAGFASVSITPGTSLSLAYTTVTAGSIGFGISGSPVLPGLKMNVYIDGVKVATVAIPMPGSYTVNFPVTQNDPTVILMSIDS